MTTCLLCGGPLTPMIDLRVLLSFGALDRAQSCRRCWQKFTPIRQHHCCPECGRQQSDTTRCSDCQRWGGTDGFVNQALFAYDDMMQDFMVQYKFRGDYRLRRVFQSTFRDAIKTLAPDLIVPVPVHPDTLRSRGFTQVTGFLDGLAWTDMLTTVAQTKQTAQSRKRRRERLATTQPFKLKDEQKNKGVGKRVLVVDDIYTTGTTIRFAADILRQAGSLEVHGLTLSHG